MPVRLTPVKTLLLECDENILAEELLRRYENMRDIEDRPTLEQCLEVIKATNAEIERCPANVDGRYVLIPQLGIEQDILDVRDLMFTVSTTLYEAEELIDFVEREEQGQTPEIPMGYAYEIDERTNILGHLAYIPERLCQALRYEALCDIWWELTFFGIKNDEADERSGRLMDSLERQTRELEAGTLETKSFDELVEEMEKECDWEPPKIDRELEHQLMEANAKANKVFDEDLANDVRTVGEELRKRRA